MNELTDLEICQRIAEIENRVISGIGSLNVFVKCEPSQVGNEQYDPLADDALCFRLMLKYDMPPMKSETNNLYDCVFDINKAISGAGIISNESPHKAICLAIIKSKE